MVARSISDLLHCLVESTYIETYVNVIGWHLGLNEALLSDNIVFTRSVGTNGKIDRIAE